MNHKIIYSNQTNSTSKEERQQFLSNEHFHKQQNMNAVSSTNMQQSVDN